MVWNIKLRLFVLPIYVFTAFTPISILLGQDQDPETPYHAHRYMLSIIVTGKIGVERAWKGSSALQ